jgi:hypothetical protein
VSEVSSSCCIPLSGANRLSRKKEKKKKRKFLENPLCCEKNTRCFLAKRGQQIAVPNRELMRVN